MRILCADAHMSTNRFEAFSDWVFAIAATLLVLELHVPSTVGPVWPQTMRLWPSYACYAVSFLTIAIIWINHHALSALIGGACARLRRQCVLKHVAGLLAHGSRARSRPRERGLPSCCRACASAPPAAVFSSWPSSSWSSLLIHAWCSGGTSGARLLERQLPHGSWPVEAYVPERQLADVVEHYGLERDEQQPDLLLRSTPEPWPFPPHARIVPTRVAALDLSESVHPELAAAGNARLEELAKECSRTGGSVRRGVDQCSQWCLAVLYLQRTQRESGRRLRRSCRDDRAEADAEHLVGLLFVAAEPLKRAEIAEALKSARRDRRGRARCSMPIRRAGCGCWTRPSS
jgi:Endosomal/lysosomal potassium channel TMEM175